MGTIDILSLRIILIATVLLIPVIHIIFGILLWKKTPMINDLYGYRTKRSKASLEAWDYANKTTGVVWLIIGTIHLFVYVPLVIILNDFLSYMIMLFVPVVINFIYIIIMEMLLARKFKN